MNVRTNFKLAAISVLLAFGLAACSKTGPAEEAGKKIDRMAEDAGKKMGTAADRMGEKMSEQSARTGVAIDDAEITTKVKAAIFAEPGLKTLQISVDTIQGVVTLTGSVDSMANNDRAKPLAAAVTGVSRVENRLTTINK